MTQIHCHVPITVRLFGEPSEAQLQEFEEALVIILRERLRLARTTILGGQDESRSEPRELFDPARSDPTTGMYSIPSYDEGGKPTPFAFAPASSSEKRREPLLELSAGAVTGFLRALKAKVPDGTAERLAASIGTFPNTLRFQVGYAAGVGAGLVHGIADFVVGIVDLLKLLVELGKIILSEEELDRVAKQLAPYFEAFLSLYLASPQDVNDLGEQIGEALGDRAAEWLTDNFLKYTPEVQGYMVGKLVGRILFEIALFFIGPELLIAKIGAGAARVLEASRLGRAVLGLLKLSKLKNLAGAITLRVGVGLSSAPALTGRAAEAERAVLFSEHLASDAHVAVDVAKAARPAQVAVTPAAAAPAAAAKAVAPSAAVQGPDTASAPAARSDLAGMAIFGFYNSVTRAAQAAPATGSFVTIPPSTFVAPQATVTVAPTTPGMFERLTITTIAGITAAETAILRRLPRDAWDRLFAYALTNRNVASLKGKVAEEVFQSVLGSMS